MKNTNCEDFNLPSLYGHLKHKISRFEKVIYKLFINNFFIIGEGVWGFCLKNSLQSIYIFNWYNGAYL